MNCWIRFLEVGAVGPSKVSGSRTLKGKRVEGWKYQWQPCSYVKWLNLRLRVSGNFLLIRLSGWNSRMTTLFTSFKDLSLAT